jgi:hypothetical protein
MSFGNNHPSGISNQFFFIGFWTIAGLLIWGRPPWPAKWAVIYSCYWSSPAQTFMCPSTAGLMTVLYGQKCVIFPKNAIARLYPKGLGWYDWLSGGVPLEELRNGKHWKHCCRLFIRCLAMDWIILACLTCRCFTVSCYITMLCLMVHNFVLAVSLERRPLSLQKCFALLSSSAIFY